MNELVEEPEQVRGAPIAWTIVGIVIAIAASVIVVGGLVDFSYTGGGRSNDQDLRLRPPAAPFEGFATPLEMRRQAQELELNAWQWTDASHTHVQLPVDLAIDRYLQRGTR